MSVLTGVEALNDGCGVDKVAPTQDTHEMLVHLAEVQPARPLHNSTCNNEESLLSFCCEPCEAPVKFASSVGLYT